LEARQRAAPEFLWIRFPRLPRDPCKGRSVLLVASLLYGILRPLAPFRSRRIPPRPRVHAVPRRIPQNIQASLPRCWTDTYSSFDSVAGGEPLDDRLARAGNPRIIK